MDRFKAAQRINAEHRNDMATMHDCNLQGGSSITTVVKHGATAAAGLAETVTVGVVGGIGSVLTFGAGIAQTKQGRYGVGLRQNEKELANFRLHEARAASIGSARHSIRMRTTTWPRA